MAAGRSVPRPTVYIGIDESFMLVGVIEAVLVSHAIISSCDAHSCFYAYVSHEQQEEQHH